MLLNLTLLFHIMREYHVHPTLYNVQHIKEATRYLMFGQGMPSRVFKNISKGKIYRIHLLFVDLWSILHLAYYTHALVMYDMKCRYSLLDFCIQVSV